LDIQKFFRTHFGDAVLLNTFKTGGRKTDVKAILPRLFIESFNQAVAVTLIQD
jgi:hypothetical protein